MSTPTISPEIEEKKPKEKPNTKSDTPAAPENVKSGTGTAKDGFPPRMKLKDWLTELGLEDSEITKFTTEKYKFVEDLVRAEKNGELDPVLQKCLPDDRPARERIKANLKRFSEEEDERERKRQDPEEQDRENKRKQLEQAMKEVDATRDKCSKEAFEHNEEAKKEVTTRLQKIYQDAHPRAKSREQAAE